ncbi:MAG: two-component system sensor histidine kinase/response regulator [Bacteriovoracaceae bacterium]|jgi:two-component system sensor histidine kinase/response regulator
MRLLSILLFFLALDAFANLDLKSKALKLSNEEESYLSKKKVIKMCIDPNWEPLEFLNSKGEHMGFSADYMKLLREKLNVKIEVYKTKNWNESLKAFADKKCDIFSQIAKTPSRLKTMLFTPPYITIPNVIIGRKSEDFVSRIEEIKGRRIGVIEGYAYVEILKRNHPELQLTLVKDTQEGLTKVSGNQLDVMIDFVSSASFHIEKLSLSNLKFVGKTKGMDLSLGISGHIDQKLLIQVLTKAVNSIPKDKVQAIKKKWINIESKQDNSLILKVVGFFLLTLLLLLIWTLTLKKAIQTKTKILNDRERYARTLFETSPVGLALCDMEGSLVDVNPAYCKIIGYTKEESLKLSYWDITPKTYEAQEGVQLESLIKTGKYGPYEKHYRHKDGRLIPVRLNGQIIFQNGIQYIWSSVEDITEAKENERKLKDTNIYLEEKILERTKELEKASQAKTNFLATMSHELRTPLNGIISPVGLLKEFENNTSEQIQLLEIAETSGQQMFHIINDILDFSKIESGHLIFEKIDFELEEQILKIEKILKSSIDDKEISFVHNIEPNTPTSLSGDPTRLTQVLLNLINNAIKFTKEGSVILNVSKETNEGIDFLNFSVKDTGIGIPKDQIQKLFSPFIQADSSTTRFFGGTGLGLSIVKKLVELQGGEVKVESEIHVGSTFSFSLPLVKAVNEQKDKTKTIEISPIFKKMRILVAEDNSINQVVVEKMLKKIGHEVTIVENGQIAIEEVQKSQYDMIFMDWQMPVLDGVEATKKIRALGGKFEQLPIVALTANVFDEDIKTCLDSGMNDVLKKPLLFEDLKEMLVRDFD